MIAFHNKPQVKANLVNRLKAHYVADEIVKGQYWQDGKGCAIGCCIHDNNHALFPELYGIPEEIAHLMDSIFEGLPSAMAKEFPLQVIESIQVGADLSKVKHHFLEWLLVSNGHPAAKDAAWANGATGSTAWVATRTAWNAGDAAEDVWDAQAKKLVSLLKTA